MLNSVTCGPAATVLFCVSTTLSPIVHLAVRSPPGPSVATEAWMVSLVPKLVIGMPMRLSAPMALPRSTVLTVRAVAAGAGAGAGAGVVVSAGAATVALAGGVVAVSSAAFFLQPATASVANSAAAIARCSVWRFIGCL